MDFQTKVELPAGLPPVSHAERILLMGSCFAENMGRLLAENKFRVDMNPFGILYNPLSVSTALVEILKGKVYQEKDLFLYKECWHSPMHHGSFSASSPQEVLEKINTRLSQAHRSVHELDWLMLTFGTAYVYEQKETRQVVSNCHKLPESCFNRRILSVDETVNEYTSLITSMVARNSHLKVLFTVSPIRHIRDGMHANQLSKSPYCLPSTACNSSFRIMCSTFLLMRSFWMNCVIIAIMPMTCFIRLRWLSVICGNAFRRPSFLPKRSRCSLPTKILLKTCHTSLFIRSRKRINAF